jgi:hypothetical protein
MELEDGCLVIGDLCFLSAIGPASIQAVHLLLKSRLWRETNNQCVSAGEEFFVQK